MADNFADLVNGIPLGRGVDILATHPEGLIAFGKPCNILSHPNSDADRRRSLIDAGWSQDRERYLWKVEDLSRRLYLLHRLDSATSGVILGCVNPDLARELKAQFSKRKVTKSYLAIVSGLARETEKNWQDVLRKRHSGSGLRVVANAGGGRSAETRVKLLETKRTHPRLSLLKLNPLTGRTHQLRVQAAKRHLPIVGDTTYGDFPFNRAVQKALGKQRLFLHASSILIRWEWEGQNHEFCAHSEIPGEFQQLMKLKL